MNGCCSTNYHVRDTISIKFVTTCLILLPDLLVSQIKVATRPEQTEITKLLPNNVLRAKTLNFFSLWATDNKGAPKYFSSTHLIVHSRAPILEVIKPTLIRRLVH